MNANTLEEARRRGATHLVLGVTLVHGRTPKGDTKWQVKVGRTTIATLITVGVVIDADAVEMIGHAVLMATAQRQAEHDALARAGFWVTGR